MQTVLITGGTGMVGRALTKALLDKGYEVIVMGRGGIRDGGVGLSFAKWNVEKQEIDAAAIAKADYIVHLAGAGVADKRWTSNRKQEIVDSRMNSGALLVSSLKSIPNKVKAVISASAIGWYGADDLTPNPSPLHGEGSSTQKFIETDKAADDFLGQTCNQWEESIEPVAVMGKRLVKLRIGIVLSTEGGALKEFIKPLQFGIASILGSGRQIISWIHIDDLVNMFITAVESEDVNGVYNAVAPSPVSNKELILTLAKARNKFYIPVPVPSFVLKMMLGEMSIEILKSATVSSAKAEKAGFSFQYPSIAAAVKSFF